MPKRRENSPVRRPRTRTALPRILVVCGAAKTEESYLKGLRGSVANRAVDVVLLKRPKDPLDVVRYTIRYARAAAKDFDEVWCVVDVDDFDIDQAGQLARDADVRLAVSNPCFELWLLLHHADCRSHCDGCTDVIKRLKRHVPAYDKTQLVFADYAAGVGDAVKRAKDLDPTGTDYNRNPSTSVWLLAETIMEAR